METSSKGTDSEKDSSRWERQSRPNHDTEKSVTPNRRLSVVQDYDEDVEDDGCSADNDSIEEDRDPSPERADQFGTLVDEETFRKQFGEELEHGDNEDEDDVDDNHIRLSAVGRKHTPSWYNHRLIEMSKRGQVVEAVHLLRDQMIAQDRVQPEPVSFTVVISALAKAGYTTLAFKLFKQMREMGIKAKKQTFTALFNACANSESSSLGLRRANRLRAYMVEKQIPPELITYKAMIKAYAMHGDLLTAFSLMDDIQEAGYKLDKESFSMLLMACVSDKQAGFKHAIEVWRIMRKKRLRPDLHQYNLLIRCVKECGTGDREFTEQLLQVQQQQRIVDGRKGDQQPGLGGGRDQRLGWGDQRGGGRGHQLVLGDQRPGLEDQRGGGRGHQLGLGDQRPGLGDQRPDLEDQRGGAGGHQLGLGEQRAGLGGERDQRLGLGVGGQSGIKCVDVAEGFPDVLSPKANFDSVVSLGPLVTASDRLALLGGLDGLMQRMRSDRTQPDIKSFTMLVDVIESDEEAENVLLSAMKAEGVSPDTTFCNLLIRKRVFRKDLPAARSVLDLMSEYQLSPDIRTFGVMALTCLTKRYALNLLKDMEAVDMAPTTDIFSHLSYAASTHFDYRIILCKQMEWRGLWPDERFVRYCEKNIARARHILRKLDQGQYVFKFTTEEDFRRNFREFMLYYKPWLMRMKLDRPEPAPRQFQELTDSMKPEPDLIKISRDGGEVVEAGRGIAKKLWKRRGARLGME